MIELLICCSCWSCSSSTSYLVSSINNWVLTTRTFITSNANLAAFHNLSCAYHMLRSWIIWDELSIVSELTKNVRLNGLGRVTCRRLVKFKFLAYLCEHFRKRLQRWPLPIPTTWTSSESRSICGWPQSRGSQLIQSRSTSLMNTWTRSRTMPSFTWRSWRSESPRSSLELGHQVYFLINIGIFKIFAQVMTAKIC